MFIVISLAALAAYALVASVVALSKDGYHRIPTDRTRLP